MIGVYHQKCIYTNKESKDKWGNINPGVSKEMPCMRSKERVFIRDGQEERVIYKTVYNIPERVDASGYIDGRRITAVEEGIGLRGELLTVKVVVE